MTIKDLYNRLSNYQDCESHLKKFFDTTTYCLEECISKKSPKYQLFNPSPNPSSCGCCIYEFKELAESNNEGGIEPISDGLGAGNTSYGDFDPKNTNDLTAEMSKAANGQQSVPYTFDGTKMTFGGQSCPYMNYNSVTGAGPRPQLIATYTCIPSGTQCVSSISKPIKRKM